MKIIYGVVITLIAEVIIILIFIYSGWYNVSAMNQESGIIKWALNSAQNRSVSYHSDDIKVPT